MAPQSAERAAREGTATLQTDAVVRLNRSQVADRAPGKATFGFEGTDTLSLVVADACLSAHLIQHRRIAATHVEIGGRRRPIMSSSILQAPDGMVCFGKTWNFETICRMPVNTAILWPSMCMLSCTAVRLAHDNTATRPPICTNNGIRTELFGESH